MIAYVTNEKRTDPGTGESLTFAGKPILATNIYEAIAAAESMDKPTSVIGWMGPENTRKVIQEMSNEKVD